MATTYTDSNDDVNASIYPDLQEAKPKTPIAVENEGFSDNYKDSTFIANGTIRVLIQVRDFAFSPSDERFRGLGSLVPKVNHLSVLHERLAGLLSESDCEHKEEESGLWEGMQGPAYGADEQWDDEEDDQSDDEMLDDEDEEPPASPLRSGLYRALYAFTPESTAEAALVPEQVVRVVGRSNSIGWAVVSVEEDGKERLALVPESYLAIVSVDEDAPRVEGSY